MTDGSIVKLQNAIKKMSAQDLFVVAGSISGFVMAERDMKEEDGATVTDWGNRDQVAIFLYDWAQDAED